MSTIYGQVCKICFLVLFLTGNVMAQEWLRVEVSDPQHGKKFTEFSLPGKFTQTSLTVGDAVPLILLRCQPIRHSSGHLHGKLIGGVLHIGGIVNGAIVRNEDHDALFDSKPDIDGFYVEYGYDGGELQADHWDNILDYHAAGFGQEELNGMLWGQSVPHKEEDGSPIKKFVMVVQPTVGGKIVMQFDLPDPIAVSEQCGCTYYKK